MLGSHGEGRYVGSLFCGSPAASAMNIEYRIGGPLLSWVLTIMAALPPSRESKADFISALVEHPRVEDRHFRAIRKLLTANVKR